APPSSSPLRSRQATYVAFFRLVNICCPQGDCQRPLARVGERLGQAFHDARAILIPGRLAEMDRPQLGHELIPQRRAAGGEQFRAHPQPFRGRAVVHTPLAELREDRHQLDRRLGQAVGGPPPRPRVLAGEQAGAHQPLEPVGEDVGGDSLFGAGEQFPEVAPVAEHDVPQDEQAPAVAKGLDRGVDRTPRTRTFHGRTPSELTLPRDTDCNLPPVGLALLLPVANRNHLRRFRCTTQRRRPPTGRCSGTSRCRLTASWPDRTTRWTGWRPGCRSVRVSSRSTSRPPAPCWPAGTAGTARSTPAARTAGARRRRRPRGGRQRAVPARAVAPARRVPARNAPGRHRAADDGVDYRKPRRSPGAHVSNETADLIVVASAVHAMAGDTAAADAGPLTALAVRGGQIAATAGPDGARDLLAAWRGPGTVVLDDPGLVVLPAFVDTHNHLMLAAQNILGVPVSQAADITGLVRLIRERAAQTPPGQWIRTAADWHELRLAERRLPTAAELDEATTDHPVLLQRGGHNGVLNSAGLRLAGIGRDTPDLEGGFIDRDAAGDPRGWVQDAALELAQRVLPPLPEQELIGGLGRASASYAANGIGTVRDAAVTPAQWHAYVRAQAGGQLTVRSHAMIMSTPAVIAAAGSVDAYLDSLEEQGI